MARAANTMDVMRRKLIGALAALALGAGAGAVLGGCGSSETKTVSVAGAPETTQSTATTTTATSTTHTDTTPTTTTSTTPAPTSTDGGTAAPGATHTAPEPEFAQQEAHGEGASEAVGVLKARGYTPVEPAQYHANQTLRVLVGASTGSSDGYGQQAFFFVAGRYIGTDTKEPSATVKVIAQSDTEVTLGYPLYRQGDPLSSPSGGQATVHFQLNNGKLVALDPIPPASSTTGTSRN
jgi:LppP/LprE lipoprotein